MAMRTVEYEVREPVNGLLIHVDDSEFLDMDAGEIEYAIGLMIQDHFLEQVSWHSKNRSEVVAEIISALKEGE